MVVRVRLARFGAKKRPFYRIVVADSRAPRDGRFIERIGQYDPMLTKDNQNRVIVKVDRLKYWLSVGAQATKRVLWFIRRKGFLVLEEKNKKDGGKAGEIKKKKVKEEQDCKSL
ncbi:30S ribosomal protein S16 [Wolbachia endosymbiont of Dipetalonema caudispina]|uniref:30S ribosomal protein S16 n=1 Tax=Wolbachia endosymbiont of Dipetalonema caudispina TaxID=1812112 RepID=UPI00158C6C2F|nr:30S ribosomal protein S16 [Wolbachia endosymbiont of Dipetalonema caudispina]QKX00845.1 30S ribosomal protein S16 [Wolbachia endosymbiont of Dipetalonema caudispina]